MRKDDSLRKQQSSLHRSNLFDKDMTPNLYGLETNIKDLAKAKTGSIGQVSALLLHWNHISQKRFLNLRKGMNSFQLGKKLSSQLEHDPRCAA